MSAHARGSAVAVLVAVVMATPLTLRSAGAAASTAADGVDDDWTRGAHSLVAYVPREFRSTCTVAPNEPDDRIDDATLSTRTGSIICVPKSGADRAWYVQFDDAQSANDYVDQLIDVETLDQSVDDTSECPSHITYQLHDEDAGRYYCFAEPDDSDGLPQGTPVLTWTFDDAAIVVQAWNTDADLDALVDFWRDDAGPLSEPDTVGVPPLPTTASLRAQGKRLLAAVPVASRDDCIVVDALTEDALQSLYPWRLWVVGDVEECRPERGSTDSEYIRFSDTVAMNDYFDAGLPDDDVLADERVEVSGINCAGTGTYRTGRSTRGRYVCSFSAKDTDDQDSSEEFAHIAWTAKAGRIAASGGAPADDVKALVRWWQQDAGPIPGR